MNSMMMPRYVYRTT